MLNFNAAGLEDLSNTFLQIRYAACCRHFPLHRVWSRCWFLCGSHQLWWVRNDPSAEHRETIRKHNHYSQAVRWVTILESIKTSKWQYDVLFCMNVCKMCSSGRTMDVSPAVSDNFKTLVRRHGMSDAAIIMNQNKGTFVARFSLSCSNITVIILFHRWNILQ